MLAFFSSSAAFPRRRHGRPRIGPGGRTAEFMRVRSHNDVPSDLSAIATPGLDDFKKTP